VGSILSVEGEVIASSSDLKYELIHPKVEIEVEILEPPTIEYYKPKIPTDLDFILDNRPIALRNREIASVFRIQAAIAHAYRLFMHDQTSLEPPLREGLNFFLSTILATQPL
jgi:nondiscriminating aspartyl-tRNA synthetase